MGVIFVGVGGAVETDICSPLGFTRSPAEGTAELVWSAGGWIVAPSPPDQERLPDLERSLQAQAGPEAAGERSAARRLTDRVGQEEIRSLRPLRALRVRWPAAPGEEEAAGDPGRGPRHARELAAVTDLAAAGVPLTSDRPPRWVREADPVLADLIAGWIPEPDEGAPGSVADLRREEHSVRLRRHALRARGIGRTARPVTVVMATRRPHLLSAALGQMARQRGADLEVIVALHGYPAAGAERIPAEFPWPVTMLEVDRATPFGEVLNLAASRATTDVIVKWDDDDWYGPEHIADLLLARAYSGADVVGTAQEFFYLEPLDVTVRRTDYGSEMWTDHVAGGTIMIDRELFHEVGGFGPYPSGEDAHLLRAVLARDGRIYRTHGLGYVLRRSLSGEHTWQRPLAHFLRVSVKQWRGFRPSVMLEDSAIPADGAVRRTA
ncbi:glycosyltransferase [Sphaerimonospora sp. CA-214678]|uniref:glycosyltransferase family 2 protein n=1 Tax=Sphaerimonospora sp. CA-214678 TaxID=3240029 RepID=UPI003D89C733